MHIHKYFCSGWSCWLLKIPLFCFISNTTSGFPACFLSPCDLCVCWAVSCSPVLTIFTHVKLTPTFHWPISVDILLKWQTFSLEVQTYRVQTQHWQDITLALHWLSEDSSDQVSGVMGSGGSKKDSLDANYNSNRRPSQHELTNPPTECRGGTLFGYFYWGSSLELKNCKFCKRSFAEDRIAKHKVRPVWFLFLI